MGNTIDKYSADSGILPFDPIVMVQDVLKRWVIILMTVVAVGVSTYILTDMFYTPVYQTNTTFVVTTRGSSASVYTNLKSTNSLASVFTELLNSSILRKTIMQEMGVTHFDAKVTTAVIPDTNLITMKVTASDPWTAFVVAQSTIDHHETLTYRVIDGIVLEVLQPPVMPVSSVNSSNSMYQMKKMMVLSALFSIVGLATLSFFRKTVRSSKEAREKLDCHFLGEIPHERKHKTLFTLLHKRKTSILITSPLTSFRYVESIRKLRRRVEQHMHDSKVLMVTSLLENEGKSTLTVNLALSMAEKNKRVLIIDCDMRKPACHAILEQRNFNYGVRHLLRKRVTLSEALIRYQKTNLYLLLEKRGNSWSGDLITSKPMVDLLEQAREEFDFIFLDLPPISAASDAESMKKLADASLLVVRQNRASSKALNKAVADLDGGHAKLMGCVLNNVYSTSLTSGQSHGYGFYNKYKYYGRKD